MTRSSQLDPVVAQPGRPLYRSVQEALIDAIGSGHFRPGQRLPSTKELSRQLSVSLVTAHRALQNLEAAGYVTRAQGRGTFVADRHAASEPMTRLGLVLHQEASLADYYHSQILEGVRQASREHRSDLVILQFEQAVTEGCRGYLFINPRSAALENLYQRIAGKTPVLVVGARSHLDAVSSVDVDNVDLIRQAVEHLHRLGHRRLVYVGGAEDLSNSRDRRQGFVDTCDRLQIGPRDRFVLGARSWKLNGTEKMQLDRLLSSSPRPTAIVAGGYYLTLDVYAAAATTALRIPADLSVVGVDDPPSAGHLSPPLTTLRQPLVHLGHSAATLINEYLRTGVPLHDLILRSELVIRESSNAPPL
jgi:DNA-binding LacI/PurR family transcriptional regulator